MVGHFALLIRYLSFFSINYVFRIMSIFPSQGYQRCSPCEVLRWL